MFLSLHPRFVTFTDSRGFVAVLILGVDVLLGDPGRQFLRKNVLEKSNSYPLPAFLGEQNWGMLDGVVWTMRK